MASEEDSSIMEQDTELIRDFPDDDETQKTPLPSGGNEEVGDDDDEVSTSASKPASQRQQGSRKRRISEPDSTTSQSQKQSKGPPPGPKSSKTAKKKKVVAPPPATMSMRSDEDDGQEVEDDNFIKLKVVAQSAAEMFLHVKIRKTSKMRKLMRTYCQHFGLNENHARFLYDGKRIDTIHTPMELEMENDDTIEVHSLQTGGGGIP